MHNILTTLHNFLNTTSFGIELVALGMLGFGWILGHVSAEYAETLKRSSTAGTLIARLCGPLTVLLGLGILIDTLWFRSYTKLPLLGGLFLIMLVVATIGQRLSQHAAQQALLVDGYEDVPIATFSKKRGS